MKCDFVVGQKVVCVDDEWPAGSWYGIESLPKKGDVYSVREVGVLASPASDILLLRVREIVNPKLDYLGGIREAAFAVSRFRPVSTRKTDISIFTDMLTTVGEPVDA